MQETIVDESTLMWLAGFLDAEGCVRVNRYARKRNNISYSPNITINNTNFYVMEYIIDILKYLDINCYVRTSKPTTNRKPTKYVEVNRLSKIYRLCAILDKYSIIKYDELVLLKSFCKSRLDRIKEFSYTTKNIKIPYNDYETNLYKVLTEYKAHKKGRKCLSFKPIYGNSVNNITWPWFAGYIDGDGSFSINKIGSLSFCIATTHPIASDKLKEFLKVNGIQFYYYSRLPSKNHLECCKKRINKFFVNNFYGVYYIANHIRPFIKAKSEIVELVIEYCKLRMDHKGKWCTDYEKSFVHKFKELTQ